MIVCDCLTFTNIMINHNIGGFPGGLDDKESACNVGDQGSIPGSGRSPGEGNGNPLQYSCLENPMDGGRLAGYSPWDCKESGITEWLHFSFFCNILVHGPHYRYCLSCDNNSNKKSLEKKILVALLCWFSSCCSITKSCPTLCDPRDCSTPVSPVIHDLPELA